jgi:UDP-N-acetylmuramate dehydrogenase
MRERRHAAQPKGIRTFGSTFKNPPGHTAGQLLADAGVAELAVGGARFSRKHANFVENAGDATTGDILALMALGRERVRERFGIVLEPEVELLGDARFPW